MTVTSEKRTIKLIEGDVDYARQIQGKKTYGSRYLRMDQVKFVEDSH